ncbi:MAG: glycosyltransferase, partial [Candidatus Omnitrophica bacterium]|nr:glycosyltransferase [Candidatus Omnitrophota bacterium]
LYDYVLPISNYWKNRLIELGCPEGKIYVHHMGINVDEFQSVERKERDVFSVLTVGRMVEKKGHVFALYAMKKVVEKVKSVEYLIVGDGPLEEELKKLVDTLELQSHVKFLGSVTSEIVLKLCQNTDLFLLPSVVAKDGDSEGIPVVLMEAMAMNLPIVSSIHTGIPELVKDGISGYLVPEKDVQGLADRILQLIQNKDLRKTMGQEGRKVVQKEFNIDLLSKDILNLINHKEIK